MGQRTANTEQDGDQGNRRAPEAQEQPPHVLLEFAQPLKNMTLALGTDPFMRRDRSLFAFILIGGGIYSSLI